MPGRCGAGPGRCAGTGSVHDRAMTTAAKKRNRSQRRKSRLPSRPPPSGPPVAAHKADGQKESPRRRRRGDGSLEERIGYRFTDAALLDSALSHISALKGARNRAGSYQRLEFLGDHVLGLVDFRHAVSRLPEGRRGRTVAPSGRSGAQGNLRRRSRARSISARRSGSARRRPMPAARTRPAILADVCEALIGAVYLDGGFPAAEALVGRLWQERMRTTAQPLRDPKTVLQEWAQARGLPTPTYREVARSGPDHDPEFRVAVHLPKSCARRRHRPLQARRRAGRRRRHDVARRRQARTRSMAEAGSASHALRLRGADRRAECRQVDAHQCARRQPRSRSSRPRCRPRARSCAASRSKARRSSFSSTRPAFSRRAAGSTAPWSAPPGAARTMRISSPC